MRRTLIRIALASFVIVAGEAVIAVLYPLGLYVADGEVVGQNWAEAGERLRLWLSVTTGIVLVGGVLAWAGGSGPKMWRMAGPIPMSSGTRLFWDTGRFNTELSPGTLLAVFGTGLVLLAVSVSLFLLR